MHCPRSPDGFLCLAIAVLENVATGGGKGWFTLSRKPHRQRAATAARRAHGEIGA